MNGNYFCPGEEGISFSPGSLFLFYNKDHSLTARTGIQSSGMKNMNLKVVVTKGEDGWYVVTVPALPGCISQGRTMKEAKQNIKEAISLYLEPEDEIVPGKGARVIEVAV